MWTVRNRGELEAVNESELLVGHVTEGGHDWVCRATGGTDGISLGDPDGLLHVSVRGSGTPGSGSDLLPVAGEHYVKFDQWKIDFPQTTGEFSLRLSIRVVASTTTRCVLEPTFSIQTSLLDTHPTLDLKSVGGTVDRRVLTAATTGDSVSVWTINFAGNAGMIAVLLGPHDAPFTTDQSSEDKIRLQLFGEFLEKGVIRKARPWVVLDRSEAGIKDDELAGLADALCQTPLPLVF
ncbi:hypothetical protein [Neorhodopirellula pilleata]|uniref:Uncharacterized protein n=1 Tax=Neorhodopirellula pilleata TaxID=2714738 RepID=A0A5C6AWU1_9BACT|nr:hypothetical protein [Neorhodopirellula pilleata]TWU03977.1 hypothetical protein Pla100_09130 [Neorhodopirellula pilleata]